MPTRVLHTEYQVENWRAAIDRIKALGETLEREVGDLREVLSSEQRVFSPFSTTFSNTIGRLQLENLDNFRHEVRRLTDEGSIPVANLIRTLEGQTDSSRLKSAVELWRETSGVTTPVESIPSQTEKFVKDLKIQNDQLRAHLKVTNSLDWCVKALAAAIVGQGIGTVLHAASAGKLAVATVDAFGSELVENDGKLDRVQWETVVLSAVFSLAGMSMPLARKQARRLLETPIGMRVALELRLIVPDVKRLFELGYGGTLKKLTSEMEECFRRFHAHHSQLNGVSPDELIRSRFGNGARQDGAGKIIGASLHEDGTLSIKLFTNSGVLPFFIGNAVERAPRFFALFGVRGGGGYSDIPDVPLINKAIDALRRENHPLAPAMKLMAVAGNGAASTKTALICLANKMMVVGLQADYAMHDLQAHLWAYLTMPKEMVDILSEWSKTILALRQVRIPSKLNEVLEAVMEAFSESVDGTSAKAGGFLVEALGSNGNMERIQNCLSSRRERYLEILTTLEKGRSEILEMMKGAHRSPAIEQCAQVLQSSAVDAERLAVLKQQLDSILERQYFAMSQFERLN